MSRAITFRIHPEGRSLHFRVNVWPDHKAMLVHLRDIGGRAFARSHHGAAAACRGEDWYRCLPDGRFRKLACCGEINCHRDELNIEIVSHETTHATLRWARRIGLVVEDSAHGDPNVSADEERFCYAQGRMVREFVYHLQRCKIWSIAI